MIFQGRLYLVHGLEPMSLPNRLAEIEDPVTRQIRRVRIAELHAEVCLEGLSDTA